MKQLSWPEMYESELVPAIFGPWSLSTVAGAAPGLGEHILDVACGTGVVTRRAAQYVGPQGRVVGLDHNKDMIVFARSLSTPSDVPIEWINGDALRLPFADATFDIVLCQGGLQYMSDRLSALREMYRVLCPNGRLALQIFGGIQSAPGFALLAKSIQAYAEPPLVEHILAPFALGGTNEAWVLVKKAGFQHISVHQETKMTYFHSAEHFVRSHLGYSCVGRGANKQALNRTVRESSSILAAYKVSGGLTFPMTGYILLAYKE